MKIFLDLATTDSPVRKVIVQLFQVTGELEFVPTADEADAIIVDEPIKAAWHVNTSTKRVAQVLWWKQKPLNIAQSDRFKIFDALPSPDRGSLPGLIEAIAFLKGQ